MRSHGLAPLGPQEELAVIEKSLQDISKKIKEKVIAIKQARGKSKTTWQKLQQEMQALLTKSDHLEKNKKALERTMQEQKKQIERESKDTPIDDTRHSHATVTPPPAQRARRVASEGWSKNPEQKELENKRTVKITLIQQKIQDFIKEKFADFFDLDNSTEEQNKEKCAQLLNDQDRGLAVQAVDAFYDVKKLQNILVTNQWPELIDSHIFATGNGNDLSHLDEISKWIMYPLSHDYRITNKKNLDEILQWIKARIQLLQPSVIKNSVTNKRPPLVEEKAATATKSHSIENTPPTTKVSDVEADSAVEIRIDEQSPPPEVQLKTTQAFNGANDAVEEDSTEDEEDNIFPRTVSPVGKMKEPLKMQAMGFYQRHMAAIWISALIGLAIGVGLFFFCPPASMATMAAGIKFLIGLGYCAASTIAVTIIGTACAATDSCQKNKVPPAPSSQPVHSRASKKMSTAQMAEEGVRVTQPQQPTTNSKLKPKTVTFSDTLRINLDQFTVCAKPLPVYYAPNPAQQRTTTPRPPRRSKY
jgi:hypothetical protein